jgi:hypothetical protein
MLEGEPELIEIGSLVLQVDERTFYLLESNI